MGRPDLQVTFWHRKADHELGAQWSALLRCEMSQRCAIYTRKSTEEGLDQAFNSLDAQREACAAGTFCSITCRAGRVLPELRMTTVGIQAAPWSGPIIDCASIADIEAGKVDVVVVYKVDPVDSIASDSPARGSFRPARVSFVSITQSFNTTTSMGRLTLKCFCHLPSSNARSSAERVRDKIAASKKKGMWMGGLPPLGYDVKDRQFVVNEEEAVNVRRLFAAYLEIGNIRQVKVWADREGIVTKRRIRKGQPCGGKPYWLGNLAELSFQLHLHRSGERAWYDLQGSTPAHHRP